MQVIAYKYFSNSKDFENWQQETKLEIKHVMPVTSNGLVQNEIDWDAQAKPIESSTINYNLIIFVTYYKEV